MTARVVVASCNRWIEFQEAKLRDAAGESLSSMLTKRRTVNETESLKTSKMWNSALKNISGDPPYIWARLLSPSTRRLSSSQTARMEYNPGCPYRRCSGPARQK